MNICELNNSFDINTPKGEAFVIAIIDYGPNINPLFLAALKSTGQFLTFDSKECFLTTNYTLNINNGTKS